ncbi:hypothetical protein CEXT_742321 [Caerostris extrusa]|uniref:Uncharacterized protein n=1 Tax=Caerostris extrusa TaxID=172846 RepID=A0AAV4TW73_CAEEX|nr:hypothetical protein CEXT_742321 [Caerostris extrusa]
MLSIPKFPPKIPNFHVADSTTACNHYQFGKSTLISTAIGPCPQYPCPGPEADRRRCFFTFLSSSTLLRASVVDRPALLIFRCGFHPIFQSEAPCVAALCEKRSALVGTWRLEVASLYTTLLLPKEAVKGTVETF